MPHQNFMKKVNIKSSEAYFRCVSSDTIYTITTMQWLNTRFTTVSKICPDGPSKFYQACGANLETNKLFQDGDADFPCGYICRDPSPENRFNYHIINDNPVIGNLLNKTSLCTSSIYSFLISKTSLKDIGGECDGYCVAIPGGELCRDESVCNGFRYGIFCDNNTLYVSINFLCDGKEKCKDGYDEMVCSTSSSIGNYATNQIVCQRNVKNKNAPSMRVPLMNFTRCGPVGKIMVMPLIDSLDTPYCEGYLDQTNCSDLVKIGLTCEINGFNSSVAKIVICNKHVNLDSPLCDNGLDKKCITTSFSCKIHKHQLCDNIIDCWDKTDETHPFCRTLTHLVKCRRNFNNFNGIKLKFPKSWIRDGVKDCRSGVDEFSNWPYCGFGDTYRIVTFSRERVMCSEVYLCKEKNSFVEFRDLCDRIESCGNEENVCRKSRRQVQVLTNPSNLDSSGSYVLFDCLKGLRNLRFYLSQNSCIDIPFSLNDGKTTLGKIQNVAMVVPFKEHECEYLFGRFYVLLNCVQLCKKSICPVKKKKFDSYNSCVGQFPDRVYTISNDSKLSFLLKKRIGSHFYYHDDYFICDNQHCVGIESICNIVDDCGDFSDERGCYNHFKCESGELIFLSMVCDNNIDCMDFSDECNEQCSKHIISSRPIRILAWLIGILSIILNMITIPRHLSALAGSKTVRSLFNIVFLIFINIGDLITGLYVQVVVIYDKFYGKSFCNLQTEWLSSKRCSVIGVLSTFGTFLSVFSMTILSINRFYVIQKGISVSKNITKKYIIQVSFLVFAAIIASLAIGLCPLYNSFEDFFVNGLVYDTQNPLLVGISNKLTLFEILRAYYGRIRFRNIHLSWSVLTSLTSNMFSNDYTGVWHSKVEFYGNDAVCLFKYLVTIRDPQSSFVWAILSFHAISLSVITISYIGIWKLTSDSSVQLAISADNDQIRARNTAMQRKIMLIIGSDVFCWTVFLIVCVLHAFEIFDATNWYPIFSLVLIPSTSVINPLILNRYISRSVSQVCQIIWNHWTFQKIRRVNLKTPNKIKNNRSKMLKSEVADSKNEITATAIEGGKDS